MKKYILSAALALILGGSSFAHAVGTPTYPGVVAGSNNQAAGGVNTQAPNDPAADSHDGGKTDYRLSCPYILDKPTVDSCRQLYEPHK